jgi:hypothetical protein
VSEEYNALEKKLETALARLDQHDNTMSQMGATIMKQQTVQTTQFNATQVQMATMASNVTLLMEKFDMFLTTQFATHNTNAKVTAKAAAEGGNAKATTTVTTIPASVHTPARTNTKANAQSQTQPTPKHGNGESQTTNQRQTIVQRKQK